ncbi:MAG: sulfite exporter TauE/SafE family protein [Alphaproteobacteria bacterium]|nr:sulfite exporter TauE/SafE family protein [Alphaproteobacteria bacterium]MBU1512529.1 sulfite exporter TauE/SafE family protein [Alphaproteobacteria bacterium]MBU2092868.1 sulfite exporter TauE/SafE family protein [Alphaproteobacteria bacterium]MBU2150893.1 sulfite exporter TauE/SafE family protein [Alphaproteobacteria bacterium]MBU2307896.1 sulfite exporter TauE/SafE family protein [Alphaproteobacteria bacterium]
MTLIAAAFVVCMAFVTATLSGVFGMAGGLVLMGALALVLPVQAAFVTHGILQLVANGWRSILHRRFVRWDIVGWYALASLIAGVTVALLSFTPSKPLLFLLLGLVPGLTWLPQRWINLDAGKPPQAFLSGLTVTGLNLTAGVAGPLLDIFFVRTELTRHAIVATKAATQVFAHLAKIVVYGAPMFAGGGVGMPPWWVFALAIPLSMLGTVAGGAILNRITDVNFKRWTRWIVTAVGISYLIQAAQLFLAR